MTSWFICIHWGSKQLLSVHPTLSCTHGPSFPITVLCPLSELCLSSESHDFKLLLQHQVWSVHARSSTTSVSVSVLSCLYQTLNMNILSVYHSLPCPCLLDCLYSCDAALDAASLNQTSIFIRCFMEMRQWSTDLYFFSPLPHEIYWAL